METYSTYQEAKIANPQSNICVSADGKFAAEECVLKLRMAEIKKWVLCRKADHCMTLEEFRDTGSSLADGDACEGFNGNVYTVGIGITVFDANYRSPSDAKHYILRAKALEQAELDTTTQQVESLAGGDWDGEGLPPVGAEVMVVEENRFGIDLGVKVRAIAYDGDVFVGVQDDGECPNYFGRKTINLVFAPLKTPQQLQQERDELEAAYELYCEYMKTDNRKSYSFSSFMEMEITRIQWINIVRKTKYRKEAK